MVNEIRIYLEGGGKENAGRARVRESFNVFLKELVNIARSKKIKWQIIVCGSCDDAYDAFKYALRIHQQAYNVLLVDSDAPVTDKPWLHLQKTNGWTMPSGVSDENCHLMVQEVEAWLLADLDTLKKFYGKEFKFRAVSDVEQINDPKAKLKEAAKKTSIGEYRETLECPTLLKQLNPTKVRNASFHCNRLFITLANKMGAKI